MVKEEKDFGLIGKKKGEEERERSPFRQSEGRGKDWGEENRLSLCHRK